jgi:hypothetical protein
VSAVIVLVLTAEMVGELAEVTMAFVARAAVMLSAGLMPVHVPLVAKATKNFPPSMALLVVALTVVAEPMFTVVWLPASKSVPGSKVPLPVSLYTLREATWEPTATLEPALAKVTVTELKVSPAVWPAVKLNKPIGVLEAFAVIGLVTSEFAVTVTAASA